MDDHLSAFAYNIIGMIFSCHEIHFFPHGLMIQGLLLLSVIPYFCLILTLFCQLDVFFCLTVPRAVFKPQGNVFLSNDLSTLFQNFI